MVYVEDSCTAAVAAVGANLAEGKWYQLSQRYRGIKAVGLVGSTNPNDCALEIFYGTEKVGEIRNSTGGANKSVLNEDLKKFTVDKFMTPGTPLNIYVKTAAATNAIVWALDIVEI